MDDGPLDSSEALWTPIKTSGTLTDRIVTRIEELIARQQLTVGSRLPSERDLARMLGVSRPALREAVKTLVAHGRLVVRHGQGVYVEQSAEDAVRSRLATLEVSLSELFAMREVLEVPAAGWAAENATDDEIAELGEALERVEAARKEPIDYDILAKLDADFHLRIVDMAKNRFLSQTVGVLQEILARGMETTLRIPYRFHRAQKEHRELYDAIRVHNAAAARTAVLRHINGARDGALRRLHRAATSQSSRNPTTTKRGKADSALSKRETL